MHISRKLRVWVVFILVGLGATGCHDDGVLTPSDPERPQPGGPVSVRLVPTELSYQVGETVVVEVAIGNASNVGSVAFLLGFNEDVLAFLPPAAEGPFMGSDGTSTLFLAAESSGGGEITVALSRLGAQQGASGAGILATFRFLATNPGSCDLRFTGAGVRDPRAATLPALFRPAQVDVVL